MHSFWRLGAPAVIALTLQLGVPASTSAAQATRDSAGVKIIDNAAPQMRGGRAPQLATVPFLDLDPTLNTEYVFGGVAGVLRLADGRVLVAARTAPQFRLFSAAGKLLSTTNEQGMAERSNADRHTVFKLSGDTIAVLHSFSVALFIVRGDSLTQITAPPESQSGPPGSFFATALSNGGSARFNFPKPVNHPEGVQWIDSTFLALHNRDGALVRALGNVPVLTFEMSPTEKQPSTPWLSAIGISCAGAGRFYYGFGNAYAIRAYSNRGILESVIRRTWTATPVTGADWEHWVVEWSRIWVNERGTDSLKAVQRVREEAYAYELPAFSACLVADNGNLWVREAHLDDAISAGSFTDDPRVPSAWSVFNAAGRWLYDVEMPTGFQPTDIGAEYVAGRFRKGPGRVAAVVYRLSVGAR